MMKPVTASPISSDASISLVSRLRYRFLMRLSPLGSGGQAKAPSRLARETRPLTAKELGYIKWVVDPSGNIIPGTIPQPQHVSWDRMSLSAAAGFAKELLGNRFPSQCLYVQDLYKLPILTKDPVSATNQFLPEYMNPWFPARYRIRQLHKRLVGNSIPEYCIL